MEKKSCTVKRNPSDKDVMKEHKSTQRLNKKKAVSSVEQPMDDVQPLSPPPPPPPPPQFSIPPGFLNEDMADIRRTLNVLRPPPVTSEYYFQKLGFVNGYTTLTYASNKKAKPSGKSAYALGRSWFKEVVTKKDKCIPKDINKEKCHGSNDDELKELLREFVEQAKAAKVLTRMSRKKGKMFPNCQAAHYLSHASASASAPSCSKGKSVTKMLSLSDILAAIEQE